jgi:hypothetical protein
MFNTKNLVNDVKQIPIPWIFEHFCKLKHKLDGSEVKIKSIFNPEERTPSFSIYCTSGQYRFKDFSTGKGGSAVDLVKELYNVPFHKASEIIIENYNDFVLHNNGGYNMSKFKVSSRYKVTSVVFRSWTSKDQYFWTQFNIGSKLLTEHNVRPLESYLMEKTTDAGPITLTIRGSYLYGYFRKDGSLYKIYQPKTLDKKFIKVKDYIQGFDQINLNQFLLITSSLKDIMAIKSLKLKNIDIIAPDSENTLIKAADMEIYRLNYKKILVMFDNDEPGKAAMVKYKETYPYIHVCYLPMSKDPSDSIRDHGPLQVRNRLVPIIDKLISLPDESKESSEI